MTACLYRNAIIDLTDKKSLLRHLTIHGIQEIRNGGESTWYRGDKCEFFPMMCDQLNIDTIARSLLPISSKKYPDSLNHVKCRHVVIAGSCFADTLVCALRNHFDASTTQIYFSEGILNTYSLLQVVRFMLGLSIDDKFYKVFRSHYNTHFAGIEERISSATDLILTLSLSEAWFDTDSNKYSFQSISSREHSSGCYTFQQIPISNNIRYLAELIDCIREASPNARVFISLTPVPMAATFSGQSPYHRTQLSDSLLLSSVLEIVENYNHVYYLPILDYIKNSQFNPYALDLRHCSRDYLEAIVTLSLSSLFTSRGNPKSIAAAAMTKFLCRDLAVLQNVQPSKVVLTPNSSVYAWLLKYGRVPTLKSLFRASLEGSQVLESLLYESFNQSPFSYSIPYYCSQLFSKPSERIAKLMRSSSSFIESQRSFIRGKSAIKEWV